MVNNLAQYRKKSRLSQVELAKKVGISTHSLSIYEEPTYNLKELSLVKLERICEVLNLKISDLVDIK